MVPPPTEEAIDWLVFHLRKKLVPRSVRLTGESSSGKVLQTSESGIPDRGEADDEEAAGY